MPSLLPEAVDRAAYRDASHPAIRFAGETLTYGALAERSDRLAYVLKERGVRRGDRVGIYVPKGFEGAVAIYGIMKAGAAYVPLDPGAPPARAATIAADCGITHVVSSARATAGVQALLVERPEITTVVGMAAEALPADVAIPWEAVETMPLLRGHGGIGESDLAYVLYTSGSTGTPKGVVHTHRSAAAFAHRAAEAYGLHAGDRVTNHAPLHFDLSTLDYFATSMVGATTVVVPEGHTKLPASLARLLEGERVTVLYAVPLALAHLLLHGALEQRDLSCLRWVLFGGEPFPPKHLRALMTALPTARFANVYGPTEVNGVTTCILPPALDGSDAPIPIGRPYPGIELVVVDELGRPVETGTNGELWVRSPTMMDGYWGMPDLEARAFATVAANPGRYYRTGDIVHADASGVFHFIGRRDRQVKTRGYRVELDEVEAVLCTHPAIVSVASFGVPDGNGSTVIEVAVVLENGSALTTHDILAHGRRVLPAYALPERVEIVAALPRTTSGKIDRVTLEAEACKRRTNGTTSTS
jgi:amino acid adenylation domain-containing protein